MRIRRGLLVAAVTFGMVGNAGAVTVANGDFELSGTFAGLFLPVLPGSDAIPGWTVGGSGISLVGDLWQAESGDQSVNMNLLGAGSLSQLVTGLTVGETYRITFAMAGTPLLGPKEKELAVSAAGVEQVFNFDTTGATLGEMLWATQSLDFVADGASTLLTFSSRTSSPFGPALDNVRIAQILAVPLPPAAISLAGALGLLAWGSRRRRAA